MTERVARTSHLTLVTAPDSASGVAWLGSLAGDYPAPEIELLTRVLEWLTPRLQGEAAKGGEPAIMS